ncbi:hypothetical protein [Pseudoduganella namucuonensis]|uniref:hypothetical protein n=1 Tax=Pseudoduganella namucuonensis TaxID=1035707 RepID=UPI000B84F026|nr:hypothetical protein [Pseudoduganella namucuonensis]
MKSVRVLLLVSVAIIAASAYAQKQPRSVLRFAEVVEVYPKYMQLPCETCGGLPDLRFAGTTFKYRCDGELYENWTASQLQVGLRIQVAGCGNLVVTKDRKVVVEGRKIAEGER